MQAQQSYTILKAVFSGFVFAFLSAALSGCAENVTDYRTEGIEQFRSRQYTESMATLRYALRKEPNDAPSNYYMGLNYRALAERRFHDGDLPAAKRTLDNAIAYFTQAVKTWPNYMAAIQAKNEALEARGKFDAALTLAEHQADTNRGIADHFVYLGDEYRERADFDNALRAYRTALATDPNNARAYASMGKMYESAGRQDLAIDAFRRARALDPAQTVPAQAAPAPAAPEEAITGSSVSQAEVASPAPQPIAPQEPTGPATRIFTNK